MSDIKIDAGTIKPNSNKYKATQAEESKKERMQPVVSKDAVKTTKKPLSRRFADTFIKEDVEDVKSWMIAEVVIPGIKNLLLDGLSMIFFGEVASRKSSRGSSRSSRGGYRDYSASYRASSGRSRERDRDRYLDDDKLDYRNIVLNYRDDAERVVDQLKARIEDQGAASVADLFDLVDIAGRYTDNNWGWTRPSQIGTKRVRDGWLIDVDEARPID
jgi:hypothetical protein